MSRIKAEDRCRVFVTEDRQCRNSHSFVVRWVGGAVWRVCGVHANALCRDPRVIDVTLIGEDVA